MAVSRHASREITMQTLFAYEFHGGDPETILKYAAGEFEGKISDLSFALELLKGVLKHREEIHGLIKKYAPEWPLDKIAPIDRAVLEIGLFEILHSRDVPGVVAIDEAIELAKTFGSDASQKFVNGVLNAVFKAKQPA